MPGSVPFLKGVLPQYAGDVMQPFVNNVFQGPYGALF